MSITFRPTAQLADDARTFELSCGIAGVLGEWTGMANAYSEAAVHGLVCTNHLCQEFGADVDETTPAAGVEVNLANGRAAWVLDLLGYGELNEGDDTAEQFLARVMLTEAEVSFDKGTAPVELDARTVEGARRVGYLQDVLGALRNLATYCRSQGSDVCWG